MFRGSKRGARREGGREREWEENSRALQPQLDSGDQQSQPSTASPQPVNEGEAPVSPERAQDQVAAGQVWAIRSWPVRLISPAL